MLNVVKKRWELVEKLILLRQWLSGLFRTNMVLILKLPRSRSSKTVKIVEFNRFRSFWVIILKIELLTWWVYPYSKIIAGKLTKIWRVTSGQGSRIHSPFKKYTNVLTTIKDAINCPSIGLKKLKNAYYVHKTFTYTKGKYQILWFHEIQCLRP